MRSCNLHARSGIPAAVYLSTKEFYVKVMIMSEIGHMTVPVFHDFLLITA
jgi:hypothetical protein